MFTPYENKSSELLELDDDGHVAPPLGWCVASSTQERVKQALVDGELVEATDEAPAPDDVRERADLMQARLRRASAMGKDDLAELLEDSEALKGVLAERAAWRTDVDLGGDS